MSGRHGEQGGAQGKEMRRNCRAKSLEYRHTAFHGPNNPILLNLRHAMLKLSIQPTAVTAIENDLLRWLVGCCTC